LNTEMLPNVEINPITPMFVSKYFSKMYDHKD